MSNTAPNSAPLSVRALFDTVVAGDYCIGCGACSLGRSDYPIRMELDEFGCFRPRANLPDDDKAWALPTVCPFSANAATEDAIAGELFAEHCRYHHEIGYYTTNYAGHVAENDFRRRGSSGGMATWILCELLEQGLVDTVVHVKPRTPDAEDGRLFEFSVSASPQEAGGGAKSRYYPVEMSQVLRFIRGNSGRYALTGIPCFVKVARLLMRLDPVFAERICFCIALVCGHLKSAAFADFLAWQCGIEPGDLLQIDFRKKVEGRRALDYAVRVEGRSAGRAIARDARVSGLFATNWGLGLFKYKACDYCDDVVGETADVSVGDAWLPQYVDDSRGTNVVVVRNPAIDAIIRKGCAERRLLLDELDPDTIAASQRGGFRHRREGLAYRLHLADAAGKWRPPKRVEPNAKASDRRFRRIIRLRARLADLSHVAWQRALARRDFREFVRIVDPVVRRYEACYRPSALRVLSRHACTAAGFVRRALLFPVKGILTKLGLRRPPDHDGPKNVPSP